MHSDITWLNVSELLFDRKNPRLAEFGLTPKSTEKEIVHLLWETMDVRELVMSIDASGFFSHESLIVAEEGNKYIVIEGNRRLAAVRLLLDGELARSIRVKIPTIDAPKAKKLEKLPVILSTREEAWRYLGFKHVNGPARWSSYAKSKYVANIHRGIGISLEDIARQIGDTHKTVQRLYRGLMVIEQAERSRVFDRDKRWYRHFYFSHLYTGLQYPGISAFIGISPEMEEKRSPVPLDKIRELGELFCWMYGNKEDNIEPVLKRQNPDLRHLDAVVGNEEALAALRNGTHLDDAFQLSRSTSRVFLETLVEAKQQLQKARGLVSTGYDGDLEAIRIAGAVATIADDLYDEMERRRGNRRKRRYAVAE